MEDKTPCGGDRRHPSGHPVPTAKHEWDQLGSSSWGDVTTTGVSLGETSRGTTHYTPEIVIII